MINTRNPWFPEIMSDIELLPIKRVARLINGFAFKSDDFGESGVSVIRIGDVSETIDLTSTKKYMGYVSPTLTQFVVRRGDILIAMTGATIGKFGVYRSDEIAYLNQRVGILRATYIDRHYLSACLATRTFVEQMKLYAYGGAQPNIGAHEIGSIIVPVPPIEYQRQITDFLDRETARIDLLIEKNSAWWSCWGRRNNIAREETLRRLRAETDERKLSHVCLIQRGRFNYRPRNSEELYGGDFPFLQTGDVAQAKKYVTVYKQTLSELGASISKKFKKGTVLMAIAANVGDVAILEFDAFCPDSVVGFLPEKSIDKEFLYYVLKDAGEEITTSSTSNAQDNTNITRLRQAEDPNA